MAWIESHQELRHHYKTKRLARELGVTVAAAVGHLHFLWWWAVDFAPDGDLSKFDDYEIADAMGYEGDDPGKAKAALIFAGFLDNNNQGALTIHDWHEHAGRTLAQREKSKTANRERQKRYRERQSAPADALQTGDAQPDADAETQGVGVSNATVTRYTHTTVTASNAPTLQNITEHDITATGQVTPPYPPASGGMGEAPGEGQGESLTVQTAQGTAEEPAVDHSTTLDRRFEDFWQLYPKRVGRGAAERAWKKIRPDAALFEIIMQSVRENIARNQNWRRDNGQYIPNPSTWLNQKRWQDDIQDGQTGGVPHGTGGGFPPQRIGGADDYRDFRASTGFRSADSDPDADS